MTTPPRIPSSTRIPFIGGPNHGRSFMHFGELAKAPPILCVPVRTICSVAMPPDDEPGELARRKPPEAEYQLGTVAGELPVYYYRERAS